MAGITNVWPDLVLARAEAVGTLEEAGAAHPRGVAERLAGEHLRALDVDAGADDLPHLLRAIGRGRVALRDDVLRRVAGGGAGGGGAGGGGAAAAPAATAASAAAGGGATACGFVTATGTSAGAGGAAGGIIR